MQLRFLTRQSGIVNDIAQLGLRLAVAIVFIVHGAADIFDAGVSTNVENYRGAGIPLPELAAPFAAYVQFVGGIAVALGAFTRPLSAGFVVVMAGALIYVHSGEPLAIQPDGSGFGFAFIMGAASLAVCLLGPGRLSVDALLTARRTRGARPIERTASAA
ncbi:MAG: DoxX family protein [Actinomycetota bacterium]|nr:DoxX family protein [Actinomycetota bacterium]